MHSGPLFPNWPFAGLDPASFGLLMVDPPWSFSLFSEKGGNKGADKHYRTLPLEEIAAFPVGDLAAPDSLLWLWGTAPMFPQQVTIAERWGFRYKTMGVWNKVTRTGKQAFGTGYILRTSHEPFIIATRGEPKTSRSVRSSFDGVRREHSRKPDEAFAMAEKLLPNVRRIEIFSRTSRKNWSHWGDQVGVFDDGGSPEKLQVSNQNDAQKSLL